MYIYLYISSYICIYVYMCVLLQKLAMKFHQLTLQAYMACDYITINHNKQTNIYSGDRWNLISFVGEPEQK